MNEQKRLDRLELREKIAKIIEDCPSLALWDTDCLKLADQILAIPDTDRIVKELTADLPENTNKKVEEAKKQAYDGGIRWGRFQEKGRIIKLLEDAFEDPAYYDHRQARIEDILEGLQKEKC